MPNLLETIKKAAIEAVIASNPVSIKFGTVKSISPLNISIEQRLTLEESHLVLTSLVSDFDIELSKAQTTEKAHVHLGLKVGETVILLQVQGGQKYIVLDRVR